MAYPIDDTQDGTGTVDYANSPGPAAPVASTQLSPEETANIEMSPEDHSLLSAVAATPHPEIDMGAEDPGQTRQDWRTWALGRGEPDSSSGVQTPGAPAPGSSTEQSQGGRVSVSSRGITEGGLKKAHGVFGETDAEAARLNAELDAQTAGQRDRLQGAYDRQKAGMAEMVDIHKEHLKELQGIHQHEYDQTVLQGQLEAQAQQQAHAEGAAYIAQYKTDMAGVRQLMMQTGNPLGGLDATGKLGLAGALFAQGFLGARYGIKVDVSGQIDHWVDRELAQHQQAISNAQNAANTNLTLYGLARQGANDEWEARQRLRGFVIDGLKSKVLMEADRYGSASAAAEAKQKAALLDEEAIKNDIALQNKVTAEKQTYMATEIDKAAKISSAATASYNASVEANYKNRMAAVAERKAAAEDAPTEPHYLSDPTTTRTDKYGNPVPGGKYLWQLDESLGKEVLGPTIKKAAEAKQAYQEVNQGLDKLKGLYDAAQPYMKGPEYARERHPEYLAYKNEKAGIISDVVRSYSGLTVTEQERANFEKRLASEDFFRREGRKSQIAQFNQDMRRHYQATMDSMVGIGLKKAPEGAGYETPTQVDQGGEARDKISLANPSDVQTSIHRLAAEVRGGVGKFTSETNKEGDFFDLPHLKKPTPAWAALMPDQPVQPEVTTRIEDIAAGLISPETFRKKHPDPNLPKNPGYLRGQLKDALTELSSRQDMAGHEYATRLLGAIEEADKASTPEEIDKALKLRAALIKD